jgi:hypothetical protein
MHKIVNQWRSLELSTASWLPRCLPAVQSFDNYNVSMKRQWSYCIMVIEYIQYSVLFGINVSISISKLLEQNIATVYSIFCTIQAKGAEIFFHAEENPNESVPARTSILCWHSYSRYQSKKSSEYVFYKISAKGWGAELKPEIGPH